MKTTEQALAEIQAEREKVKEGPFGPEHDAALSLDHLTGHVFSRLRYVYGDAEPSLEDQRKVWVQVGQFSIAALERLG